MCWRCLSVADDETECCVDNGTTIDRGVCFANENDTSILLEECREVDRTLRESSNVLFFFLASMLVPRLHLELLLRAKLRERQVKFGESDTCV